MPIEQILSRNSSVSLVLKKLMDKSDIKSGTALAKNLGIPAPTINRLLSGHVLDPRASTLSLLADYFNISIDQLLGKETINWVESGRYESNLLPSIAIPVLSKSNAITFDTNYHNTLRWYRWSVPNKYKHTKVFAIEVDDISLEPDFTKGTLLILNPELEPNNQDYVAVHIENDHNVSIKRIIFDNNDRYLYPIKKGHKILNCGDINFNVIGVIIEAHTSLVVPS